MASHSHIEPSPLHGVGMHLWQSLWHARLDRCAADFARTTYAPQRTQDTYLSRLIKHNADSAYGKAHNFASIKSVADYQVRVPIVDYDTLAPWIAQAAQGVPNVLTHDPVLDMRTTAGQSGRKKHLPVTEAFTREVSQGMDAWLARGVASNLGTGRSLCWLSYDPLLGMGRLARLGLSPHLVETGDDVVRDLIMADDLRVLYAGNPAFLVWLVQELNERLADVLATIPDRRSNAIRAAIDRDGGIFAHTLWPALHTVVAWNDGPGSTLLCKVEGFFHDVTFSPAPILTHEALVTVPHPDYESAPLAVNSHFFEFIDLDAPRKPPVLSDALRDGGLYRPVVSTGAGLYRYMLSDVVRCTGFMQRTPLLTYVDRATAQGDVSAPAIQTALERSGVPYAFALCHSTGGSYTLHIDTKEDDATLTRLAAFVEEALCDKHGYWQARKLEQLAPLRVVRVHGGWDKYVAALKQEGLQPSEIKASAFDARGHWESVL